MSALVDHRTYLADVLARQAERRRLADPGHAYAAQPVLAYAPSAGAAAAGGPSNTSKGKSKANVVNYIGAEEAVRNDYAAWYGVSGEYPTNYVLGAGDDEICDEFPALRRLMDLKAEHVASVSHPPLFAPLAAPSPALVQSALAPHRFDVVLIHRVGSWAETAALPVRQLSADPGFVFLWVGRGDSDGLERGRECLAKWGFRRAEDIVWVKTNRRNGGEAADSKSLFASQKEHCLMGIRGTVRRSTDSRFLHCNVDTDVIVWEGDDDKGPRTPPYLYTLIENFCLGARRLELFGDGSRARRGWVTASVSAPPDGVAPFEAASYAHLLPSKDEGKPVVPFHAEIDALRPKSPQRRVRGAPGGGGGGRHGQGQGQHPHAHPHHSPSPQPPFRPGSAGVMRMGALTPAYPQQQTQQMAQQPMGGVPMMVPPMMMGQMGGMGMGQMGMGGMGGMGMGMGQMGGMPMGGLGVMGMGNMPWPGGMMMPGIPGMVPGMGMGGMGMMVPGGGMGGGMMGGGMMGGMPMAMGMGAGMGGGGLSPQPQQQHGGASPAPDDAAADWSQHHQHHMGQLALGMGNMGVGGPWQQQQQQQNEHGQWQ